MPIDEKVSVCFTLEVVYHNKECKDRRMKYKVYTIDDIFESDSLDDVLIIVKQELERIVE